MSAREPFKRVERRYASGELPFPTTDPRTSSRMALVRQRDTAPELVVRALAHGLGLRYRTRNRDLPGSPDLANRARRWVIFVHGCFWHRHNGCRLASRPKSNAEFWEEKFAANVTRDRAARAALRRQGYAVLTVWECDSKSATEIVAIIAEFKARVDGKVGQ